MSFLYPLGLLGLIGIPVLIIIYIIKNKYTEQVVSATYLWTLSEKFLKRRNPINKLVGIISLILQIIIVLLISFAIAHPVFTLFNAANDYCFILDGSGSMNIAQADKTRLDLGKEQITSIINNSVDGSSYTLIFAGQSADVIGENVEDKEQVLLLLDTLSAEFTGSNYVDAIGAAQEYFNANPSVKTYLVTDKDYEESNNVEVINVSANEENYAVSGIEYTYKEGSLVISGNAYSYESNAELNIELYLDGSESAVQTLQRFPVKKLEPAAFEFVVEKTSSFKSIKIVITNQDALALDNEIIIFNVDYENSYKTLLVGENSFYIMASLIAMGKVDLEVITPKQYTDNAQYKSGYGLYIYDSFSPEELPRDGAVWMFNPPSSVAESGFSVQDAKTLLNAGKLSYTTSSSSMVKTLLKNLTKKDIYVKQYVKCGLYRNFTTLLSFDGSPVVFTGTNTYGNREVVFAFDIHESSLPGNPDLTTLTANLLNYAFPTVLEKVSFGCGETMEINVITNCDSIRVDTPLGNIAYLDTSNAVSEYVLTEVGAYTVTMMIGDTARPFNVYSSLPEEERFTTVRDQSFNLQGESSSERRDGIYDNLLIMFIVLAVIFIADWMVYCYEQYQLR